MDWSAIGSSALTSGINNILNRSNMATQQEYNMQMLNAQNAFTEYMYDKNNEYNTPDQQRKRLLAAGLNPILVGQMNGNVASAMSSGNGGGSTALPGSPIENPILTQMQYEQMRGKKLENDAQEYENKKKGLESSALDMPWMQVAELDENGKETGKFIPVEDRYGNKTLGQVLAHNKIRFDIESLSSELKKKKAEADKESHEARNAKAIADNAALRESYDNMVKSSQKKLNESDAEKAAQEVLNLKEDINRIIALVKNIDADTENIKADTDNKKLQNELLQLQKQVTQTSNSLLLKGFSSESIGDLIKVMLLSLVKGDLINFNIGVGRSHSTTHVE